jgi:ABC-type glycerol-3-phosphate transport system permease component
MADIDTKRLPLKVAGRLVVWGSIVAALVPLIFMLITSIKPTGDTQTIPPKWVFVPTLEHYEAVFGGQTSSSQAFLPLLWHSAIVAVCSTALTILVGLPAAYALARVRFKGRKFLATWILSTIMFPPIVAAIPVFIIAGQRNGAHHRRDHCYMQLCASVRTKAAISFRLTRSAIEHLHDLPPDS